jgi:hypothetical protein
MSRQGFAGLDAADCTPANSTAIASTTTATQYWNQALWTPVAANDPRPGKIYKVCFGGILSTTGTPTVTWAPVWGTSATYASNAALGISATVTTGSGLAAVPVYGEFTLCFRQVGVAAAGATCVGTGLVTIGNVAAATGAASVTMGSTVPTTIDHTIAGAIGVFQTWSANSGSNTTACQWAYIQTLN